MEGQIENTLTKKKTLHISKCNLNNKYANYEK